MRATISLGSVRGIAIGMNWSLLVIFALVTVGLAFGRFPLTHPGEPVAAYVAAGLVTGILFFGSVLAHELGHALLAQRKGVEVEGITLWLFGGVARFRSEPRTAGDDLAIAAIGPGVSLALGALFGAVWLALDAAAAPGLFISAAGWLALINVVLAVFNMAPAAPLDGGRVLRALLWRRSGDRRSAAQSAARAGRIFGFALIALGIVEFAIGAGLGGLWIALIGWFIVTAARSEEQVSRLQGLKVREAMTPDPVVAPDWLTVQAFLDQYVFAHRFSCFPLRSWSGELSGLAPLSAVKRVPIERRAEMRVHEIACPRDRVPACHPDEELSEVLPRLSGGCSDGRAFVLDDAGELVGILSPTDVSRVMDLEGLRTGQPSPQPAG